MHTMNQSPCDTGSPDVSEGQAAVKRLLADSFPQLTLKIAPGMSKSNEYREKVLQGKNQTGRCLISGKVCLTQEETPAGAVKTLLFEEREDFLYALQALAYRAEPTAVPDSVGASTVSGLINWEKIHQHRREYLAAGGKDWSAEFRSFTSQKENYLDTVILLSSGDYSDIPAEAAGVASEEWKEKSITIRRVHELTHFVCRKFFPQDIDPVRDEVIADMTGMLAAFGEYSTALAEMFLGIEGESLRDGGRLTHYVAENMPEAVKEAKAYIRICGSMVNESCSDAVVEILLNIMRQSERFTRQEL